MSSDAVKYTVCPQCKAGPSQRCTSSSGKACSPHAARRKLVANTEPTVAEKASRPTYQPGQRPQYEPAEKRERKGAAATAAEEDAQKFLAGKVYGTIDPSLDAYDVVEALLRDPMRSYSEDEVDDIRTEYEAELTSLREACAEREEERKSAEERSERACGKAEQLEVDLANARDALALASADVIRWRTRADDAAYRRVDRDGNRWPASSGPAEPAEGESGYD